MLVSSSKPPALYTPGSFRSSTHLSTIFGACTDAEETGGAEETGPWTCFQSKSLDGYANLWIFQVFQQDSLLLFMQISQKTLTQEDFNLFKWFLEIGLSKRDTPPELHREKGSFRSGISMYHVVETWQLGACHPITGGWCWLTSRSPLTQPYQSQDQRFNTDMGDLFSHRSEWQLWQPHSSAQSLIISTITHTLPGCWQNSSWTCKASLTMRCILCRRNWEELMGRLFAKETERRQQEMEMGREMKRRRI